jgi:transcriptional regulator with XRE-family HTH domain
MSSLADRVKRALEGPPKRTQSALAAACGIKPPSVSDWLTGKTKTLEGANLLNAARFLEVRPEWLASGTPPMRSTDRVADSANVLYFPSQPAGLSDEIIGDAMKLARFWLDLEGSPKSVEDSVSLLRTCIQVVLEENGPASLTDLSKKLAARLREEKANGDQRREAPGTGKAAAPADGRAPKRKPGKSK